MSDTTALERSYRRILACYPRSFLRENADEVLAVLLDTAAKGQTRVRLAEAWDLVRGGVRMRLWPAAPRPRAVRAAVTLMLAGAAAELATTIAAAAVWAIGLASVVLIFTPAACRYYRPPLAQQ
jgi:hypothetical protein